MHVRNARRAEQLAAANPVTLIAFDLLCEAGEDVMSRPLTERRARLEALDVPSAGWQVPATYDDGEMLYEATKQQRLEGIVSKKLDAPYRSGPCSTWIKVRNPASIAVQRERSENWNKLSTTALPIQGA